MSLFLPDSLSLASDFSSATQPTDNKQADENHHAAAAADSILPAVSSDAFSSFLSPIPSNLLSPAALNLNWEKVFRPLLSSGLLAGLCLIDEFDGRWLFQSGLATSQNLPAELIVACLNNYETRELTNESDTINNRHPNDLNSPTNTSGLMNSTSARSSVSSVRPPLSPFVSPSFSSFSAFRSKFLIYSRSFSSFYSVCKYKRIGLLCHSMPFRAILISIYTRPQTHATIIPWIEKEIQILKL